RREKVKHIGTSGNISIKENFANLFGVKSLQQLSEFKFSLEDEEDEDLKRPMHNCGKSTMERQYVFVNKRPVDMPKIEEKLVKVINEVYKTYNMHQYPTVLWNMDLRPSQYDVNVTPDKRTLFLHNDKALFERIREKLQVLFEPSRNVVSSSALTVRPFDWREDSLKENSTDAEKPSEEASSFIGKRKLREEGEEGLSDSEICLVSTVPEKKRPTTSEVQKMPLDETVRMVCRNDSPPKSVLGFKQTTLPSSLGTTIENPCNGSGKDNHLPLRKAEVNVGNQDVFMEVTKEPLNASKELHTELPPLASKHSPIISLSSKVALQSSRACSLNSLTVDGKAESVTIQADSLLERLRRGKTDPTTEVTESGTIQELSLFGGPISSPAASSLRDQTSPLLEDDVPNAKSETRTKAAIPTPEKSPMKVIRARTPKKSILDDRYLKEIRTGVMLDCGMEGIQTRWRNRKKKRDRMDVDQDGGMFEAGIGPETSDKAVEEFNKYIKKDDFKNMKILGQFNLGFIIARLEQDLFIIDQHASDEKFNYEHFTRTLQISTQPLIRPIVMQLTAQLELVALDYRDILRKNGFEILADEDAPPGSRIKLTGIPQSSTLTFGMSASKACRKSVMIEDMIGVISSLTPFVALLSAPAWTYAVDYLNKRIVILVLTSVLASIIQWGFAIPGLTFAGACGIAVLQSFFAAPVFPLVDALILDLLGDDQDAYGQQRLWAAISCGLTYVLTSLGVTYSKTYLAAFALQSFWLVVFLGVLLRIMSVRNRKAKAAPAEVDVTESLEASPEETETSETTPLIDGDLAGAEEISFRWIGKANTLIFLLCMAILGTSFAVVQNFLWLYLTEYKNATKLLLGLTGPFSIAVELPFFFFSKSILRKIGMKNCIILGHAAMALRVFLYTILPSGNLSWLVLAIELLHGLSFSLMWTAGVRFASSIAPKSMGTTAQGLLNGAHFGLGFGIGSIVAGHAYSEYGPVIMFRASATALVVSMAIMTAFVREPTTKTGSAASTNITTDA
ncbi:Mismatch repair endonuclease pms2, partial [Dinochytrium kinnereticum]